jgi:undecaprenyl-diphosphatase
MFLGLVQGIAEFLPVSSSGHLSILQNLLNLDYSEENHLLFEVFLHLATLISVCVVYRQDIKAMLSGGVDFLRKRADNDTSDPVMLSPPGRTLFFVIVGTIPLLVAVIFYKQISRLFFNTGFIGFSLIMTGVLLFVSDKFVPHGQKTDKTMTIADAILIGLAQAVAIIPGLSRSGTTIAVGLSRGLTGNFAVRFSLLLSIPAIIGSLIVTLFSTVRGGADFSLLPTYLAGFVIAAVVGFFAIQILRILMNKGKFGNFAYYCWGIGALTLILSFVIR